VRLDPFARIAGGVDAGDCLGDGLAGGAVLRQFGWVEDNQGGELRASVADHADMPDRRAGTPELGLDLGGGDVVAVVWDEELFRHPIRMIRRLSAEHSLVRR
jgi:hypothetical protein